MPALFVNLVGGLRATSREGREIRLTSRKAQALLGCLALNPGARIGRDYLASLLWSDSDTELARSSLRQALAGLRRALPADCASALKADAVSVWLDASLATSDVAQFQARLRAGTADPATTLQPDVGLGELMAGLDARSVAFEQWLEEQRRSLRRQRVDALERVAAHCGALQDLDGQRTALEALVALEPVNERAHRSLMDVLARQGRHTDALRQYRTCRDALRRELDVGTEPATDALHREILRRRRASEAEETTATDHDATAVPATAAVGRLRDAVVLCVRAQRLASGGEADPERARQREAALATRVRAEVERFGGRAGSVVQGEIVAAFGLEATTGNEIARATRVALELAASGADVGLACGLAGGQVLAASRGDVDSVNGRPVAQARQLARHAAAGDVYVTAELTGGLGGGLRVTPLDLDGMADARRVVEQVHDDTMPAAECTFIGRRAELALLTALLDRVVGSGKGRVIVVRGEAGIGKTALIGALTRAALGRNMPVHAVRVLDFGQSAFDRPLPALARSLLGSERAACGDEVARLIDLAIDDGRLSADQRAFAAELVGATSPGGVASHLATLDATALERGRAAVLRSLLDRPACPRLLVVEDVHWADVTEIAQLADLAASLAAQPVLLALSTRVDEDPLGPTWRARNRGCPTTTLDLAPFDDDEARAFAAAQGEWPAAVLERCLAMAEGHPLYLEQLLRASASGATTLPGNVRGLVVARIERLAPAVQEALQAASVLGSRFRLDALGHLLGGTGQGAALEESGLVGADGEERRFAHALIRDAVYESLLGSTRRALHQRAAAWFDPRDAGLCADHLAAADDPRAAAAYTHAANESLRAHRLERAHAYAERARDYAHDPRDHGEARATLGDVQLAQGRTLDACTSFRESIELATERPARARGWLGLATALRVLDRYDEALSALDHAAREIDPDDLRRQVRLWTLRGNLHFPRGELDLCLDAHQRALEYAQRADSVEDVARALGGLGDAQYQRGRMHSAYVEFRRCVELCERHGLAGLRLAYLPMVAATQVYIGELEGALETCETAEGAARETGDRRAEMLAHIIVASVELSRARFDASFERGERALAIARDLGARRFEAENLAMLGFARLGRGEQEQARAILDQAVELAREACPTYCGPWALAGLALACGEPLRATTLLAEAERLLERGCVSHNHLEFRHAAMMHARRHGDWPTVLRHADALEEFTREEPLEWADLTIRSHRALAAAAAGKPVTEALRAALTAARDMQFCALVPPLDYALQNPGFSVSP